MLSTTLRVLDNVGTYQFLEFLIFLLVLQTQYSNEEAAQFFVRKVCFTQIWYKKLSLVPIIM